MQNAVADRDEVKARWGYSELFSQRFARDYASVNLSAGLRDRASKKADFSDLLPSERAELVRMLSSGPRNGLAASLDAIETFQCSAWSKEELVRIWAISAFDPNGKQHIIPYLSFLAGPRLSNDPNDPRSAADLVATTIPFKQDTPGIVTSLSSVPVLVDGYCRSVLFMRSENTLERFLVWVPLTYVP